MELTAIESSNIKAVGYNDDEQELHVQFNSGKTYSYAEVPQQVYDDFMAAESKGKFFFASIKSKFESTEVVE